MASNDNSDLPPESNASGLPQIDLSHITRIAGVFILVFGLYVAYQVVKECWELYNDPSKITKFAKYIDEGSNIDNFGNSFSNFMNEAAKNNPQAFPSKPKIEPVKISYFVSWPIVFILLLIIAKVGYWAVTAGGQLAMHKTSLETELAKQIVREVLAEGKKI